MLFGLFCLGAAAACFGYYIFAANYAGIHSAFLWFWPLATAGFLVLAALTAVELKYHFLHYIPKWIRILFVVIISLGMCLFLFLEGCVISGMWARPKEKVDYVVVLGAQVRGTRVTKSLAKRLDAAFLYAEKYEDCKVIVTGGQGEGEAVTEASAMKKYLVSKGMKEERILLEDKSTTTKENLLFSQDVIEASGGDYRNAKIVIVSNNFHIFRAKRLAKKMGYMQVEGLAAPSDNHLIVNYMIREGLAIFKEWTMGNV